jgi:hypothetical protein
MLSHRAGWIHPDDHAALAAELERVTAANTRLERILYPPKDSPQRDDASGEARQSGVVVSADE